MVTGVVILPEVITDGIINLFTPAAQDRLITVLTEVLELTVAVTAEKVAQLQLHHQTDTEPVMEAYQAAEELNLHL